ncbi:MAG: hypothetical protein RIR26_727 [Pseudomonadota bacterium]
MSAIVPSAFWELGGQTVPCAAFSEEWKARIQTEVLKVWTPHIQAVWFRGLARVFRRMGASAERPTVLLALMEPYSLSALFAFCLARIFLPRATQIVLYSAQNMEKEFSLPLQFIQRFIFRRAACVLALSEEVESVLRRQGYRGRIIRFPLWADSSLFHMGTLSGSGSPSGEGTQEPVRVGYCGAVTEAKGVPDLVSALELLSNEELRRIQFEVAGGGPLFEELSRRLLPLKERGLQFVLHGSFPATALPDFFRALDILVVPSRTEANWKEQFGRVIVEAWACGVNVIGSNSGEIPVLLSSPELIFEERKPESLLHVLRGALAAERSAQSRQRNAERAKPYLDVHLAERFASELQTVLLLPNSRG